MKKSMLLVMLVLVVGLTIACDRETTTTTTATESTTTTTITTGSTTTMPSFPDTPMGHLEEQEYRFNLVAEQSTLMDFQSTLDVDILDGDRVAVASLLIREEIFADLASGYLEYSMTQGSQTITAIWETINGRLAQRTIAGDQVYTELADLESFDDLVSDQTGDLDDLSVLPDSVVLTENQTGYFTARIAGEDLEELEMYQTIQDAVDMTSGVLEDMEITMDIIFEDDSHYLNQRMELSYSMTSESETFEVTIVFTSVVSFPLSQERMDLSEYTVYDPRDKELAVPVDPAASVTNHFRDVAVEPTGETVWVAYTLDPGYYLFRNQDGDPLPNAQLITPEGTVLNPEAAAVETAGTYYLGLTRAVGVLRPNQVWLMKYPVDQVGTPASPIYYQPSGYIVSGTLSMETRYFLYPPLQDEQLVVVTVNAETGTLYLQCESSKETLEDGETYVFRIEANSPVILVLSGNGTYTIDLSVEGN